MDNEEDYIELHRLLAKCKFYLNRELAKLTPSNMEHTKIIEYYESEINKIDNFIVNIPIIIKGEER